MQDTKFPPHQSKLELRVVLCFFLSFLKLSYPFCILRLYISFLILPSFFYTLAEVLCTTPEFATLCSLATKANLTDILNSTTDTLTLFAPTVAAFKELPEKLVAAAFADTDITDLLTFLLFGHVVLNQEIPFKDLRCGGALTMANGKETTITCTPSIDSDGNNTGTDTFITGRGNLEVRPQIIGPDGLACNGIVHTIDYVILPASVDEMLKVVTVAPVAEPSSE